MLTLTGKLINTYVQPKSKRADGTETGGQDKVQILGDIELPDGGRRCDMYTLSTHDIASFKPHTGKDISFTVGVFATGRNLTFFIPKGTKPKTVAPALQG
jgi:hypothetical protein